MDINCQLGRVNCGGTNCWLMKAGWKDREKICLIGRNAMCYSFLVEKNVCKMHRAIQIESLDRVDFHSYDLVRDVIRRIPGTCSRPC